MNLLGTPLSAVVAAFLFAGSSPDETNVARWQQSLSDARDISAEAAEAAASGNTEEAVRLYEDAMIFGRKAAVALHERGVVGDASDSDLSVDDESPLDWLIGIFRDSALMRIQLDDIDGARKDAWGACLYSQNADIASLECLAKVCEAGGDDMGRLMALKNILQLDDTAKDDKKLDSKGRRGIESAVRHLETKLKA
jgi:hypothetical protein